jgi:hypothetical protein
MLYSRRCVQIDCGNHLIYDSMDVQERVPYKRTSVANLTSPSNGKDLHIPKL